MPTEDRALSQFPTAAAILAATLVMVSTPAPDAPSGYDTNKALAADLGRAILGDFAYTQELQTDIKTIFGAINSLRVLSGTTTPTAQEGANGQLYFKFTVDSQTQEEEITNLYWKRNGTWLEVQLGGGGGGGTDYIECTQAQYDAWEQGGTLDPDTLYFITDGNIGNDIIDDSTTSASKVWSSNKTNTEIQAVASDVGTNTTAISNITTAISGFNIRYAVLESNVDVYSPSFSNVCLAFVGRQRSGMYIGSGDDVQTIVQASNISIYKINTQLRITNTSTTTSIVCFIYK